MDWLNETIFIITTGTKSNCSIRAHHTVKFGSRTLSKSKLNSDKAAMGGIILLLLGKSSISKNLTDLSDT